VRHFAAVLRSLRRRGPIRCLVNAQPERYAARLRWALAFSGINLECVSFDPTFRLLQDCLESVDFALGCDSGPMHFAALLGVPTVVVYGPFPASEFRPIARTISVSSSVPGLPAAAVSPASVRAAAHRMVDRLIAGSPWSDNVI
jgi:ADP-heptose:LPS heptosyltransferase